MKRVAALVAINVAAVVLVVGLFGIGLRVSGDRFYTRTQPGARENNQVTWARVDPDLGWVFSGTNTRTFRNPRYNVIPIVYRANAQGFRETRDFNTLSDDGGRTRVLMLGNSFVFGVYIDENDTLPARLQSELGGSHEVFNLGIPGWGVDQMVLAYRKYRDAIAADIVILVYTDSDVARVFEAYRLPEGLNKPSFRLQDGKLIPRTGRDTGPDKIPIERLAGRSLLANRLYRYISREDRSQESRRVALAFLSDFARETAERGETGLVVRYPTKGQMAQGHMPEPFDFAEELSGYHVVYVQPDLRWLGQQHRQRMYLTDDGHPSRGGNEFMAEEIARVLR